MARRALFIVVVSLAALLLPGRAGAQTTIDDWWLTGYGSAHCVLTANHFMCERFDAYGNSTGYAVDHWLPAWCRVDRIDAGNANGATMRIRLVSPLGWGAGCYPGYDQHPYWGWQSGTGIYEGQHSSAGYTGRSVTYIPGRDPAGPNAYGTAIEVW